MKSWLGARKASRISKWPNLPTAQSAFSPPGLTVQLRFHHNDGRQRLSNFWVPTGGIAPTEGAKEDSHALLIRAGFIRQAHAGLFQFLPLGVRIQEKLERLLDKHMIKLGASKLSLSAFSSEELWKMTGRLNGSSSELFKFEDRKSGKYILSPTHEEEITSLVGSVVKSYKELPLKLYQISRKYRDEPRPRQGLLRTREFLMKDLYTFDISIEEALKTYETVRQAYTAFFNEFKIPYLTAEASSGEIGGDLSHEYHFPSSKGEDNIITCDTCDYVANEELAECESGPALLQGMDSCGWNLDKGLLGNIERNCDVWFGVTQDRSTLLAAVFPRKVRTNSKTGESSRDTSVNPHVLKRILPTIDMSVEDPLAEFKKAPESQRRIFQVYDERLPSAIREIRYLKFPEGDRMVHTPQHYPNEKNKMPKEPITDLIKIGDGDTCTKCKTGTLKVQTAVELGHTFHLGTRYSKPLEATVAADPSQIDPKSNTDDLSSTPPTSRIPIQMGCHGIGVSRLIAAVADSLADSKGLNWPSVMAPFEAVVVPTKNQENEAAGVYDMLTTRSHEVADAEYSPIDTILDDRKRDLGWKLKDADMIGYPVIVVVGRDWKTGRKVEVQCRRLGVTEMIAADGLHEFVAKLLREL